MHRPTIVLVCDSGFMRENLVTPRKARSWPLALLLLVLLRRPSQVRLFFVTSMAARRSAIYPACTRSGSSKTFRGGGSCDCETIFVVALILSTVLCHTNACPVIASLDDTDDQYNPPRHEVLAGQPTPARQRATLPNIRGQSAIEDTPYADDCFGLKEDSLIS